MSRGGRHGAEQNRSPFPQGRRDPNVFHPQIPQSNPIFHRVLIELLALPRVEDITLLYPE